MTRKIENILRECLLISSSQGEGVYSDIFKHMQARAFLGVSEKRIFFGYEDFCGYFDIF